MGPPAEAWCRTWAPSCCASFLRPQRRWIWRWMCGFGVESIARSPSSALLPILGGGFPSEIDYRKQDTPVLTSLLEDPVRQWVKSLPPGSRIWTSGCSQLVSIARTGNPFFGVCLCLATTPILGPRHPRSLLQSAYSPSIKLQLTITSFLEGLFNA